MSLVIGMEQIMTYHCTETVPLTILTDDFKAIFNPAAHSLRQMPCPKEGEAFAALESGLWLDAPSRDGMLLRSMRFLGIMCRF